MVRGMDWAESEGALDVYLCHRSSSTESYHGVYCIVDGGVAQREVTVVNAVINTVPWGIGKVHNKAPFP